MILETRLKVWRTSFLSTGPPSSSDRAVASKSCACQGPN
jgi:hypothetical protein